MNYTYNLSSLIFQALVSRTMASTHEESWPRGSAEFIESSVLEVVVPNDSDVDFDDELTSWDGTIEDESGSILPFLSQRNLLLLGKST